MFEIILSLLISMGLWSVKAGGSKPIIVIDQSTGISYGVGVTAGIGSSITTNNDNNMLPDIYYLVRDSAGKYRLVKK